jgi:tripeptidyl-peptidase-1
MSTAQGVNTTFWSIPWVEFGKDLLSWTQQVQGATNAPLVHSVSWGSSEIDSAQYDVGTMRRLNTEFMKMGLAGMSIVTASGDGGTGKTGLFDCGVFDPTWPASSPFVTAVGGTSLTAAGEVGWGSSGGGFSTLWPRPAWQQGAVDAYLKVTRLPPQRYWNASGRAIPDVAALAENFQIYTVAGVSSLSGTSAATPVFAAMIALVNDRRIAAGKSPL